MGRVGWMGVVVCYSSSVASGARLPAVSPPLASRVKARKTKTRMPSALLRISPIKLRASSGGLCDSACVSLSFLGPGVQQGTRDMVAVLVVRSSGRSSQASVVRTHERVSEAASRKDGEADTPALGSLQEAWEHASCWGSPALASPRLRRWSGPLGWSRGHEARDRQ